MSEKTTEKDYTHSIELIGGYTDKEKITHTKVTFGRRLTVGDLMNIDDDPQSQLRTQYEDLVRRRMMTAFGTLKVPVQLPILLSLDRIDRQDLAEAANEFVRNSRGEGSKAEYLDGNRVKLFFGFKIGGEVYDTVQFGNRLTGNDDVEADRQGFTGIRRLCFELGRQISRLESSEHSLVLDGKVSLEQFEKLDSEDLNLLSVGGEMFTQSFRARRKEVPAESDGADGVSAGAGTELDGKRNSKSAKRAD